MKNLLFSVILFFLVQGCHMLSEKEEKSFSHQINRTHFSAPLILKNVNLIDGNGTPVQKRVSVYLKNRCIVDIDSIVDEELDSNTKVIDLSGKYMIPGLIESHSHVCKSTEEDLIKALHFGITSIRDMAGDGAYLLELKQAIENGELEAPDLYFSAVMAGPGFIEKDTRARISTPDKYELGEAPWMQKIDYETNIKNAIKRAKDCGATGLKLYAELSKEIVQKLALEAHKQGIQVWSHAYIGPANVLEVSETNVDAISHIPALLYPENWDLKRDGAMIKSDSGFRSEYFQKIIKKLKERQIIVDATLSIYKSYCNNDEELMKITYDLTNLVYKEGIQLVAGTDNSLILKRLNKPALYDEIITIVNKCGISPLDAIKFATKNGAMVLGIGKTHGTVEVGKVANLLVLDKNPLENIENIESIQLVIKNGNIIKSER